MLEHAFEFDREIWFAGVFGCVAFIEALDLCRVVGEFLSNARKFGALCAAEFHFVDLQYVLPGHVGDVRLALLRLVDWGASGSFEEERDVTCGYLVLGHQLLHAHNHFETEFVTFEETAHCLLLDDFDQHLVDLLNADASVDFLFFVILSFLFDNF